MNAFGFASQASTLPFQTAGVLFGLAVPAAIYVLMRQAADRMSVPAIITTLYQRVSRRTRSPAVSVAISVTIMPRSIPTAIAQLSHAYAGCVITSMP